MEVAMTTKTQTISEFLLARIDERESEADYVHHSLRCNRRGVDFFGISECTCEEPARVRAECEAKRRIVEFISGDSIDSNSRDRLILGEIVLEDLASVDADHPDYRDEWRA